MTNAQYMAWLAELSVPRVILAELDYAGGTEYVSTYPYISLPSDSDPNRVYDDLLTEAVDIDTRIDGLISFGEISLVDDGAITDWVGRAWQGHEIRLYLGGPDWSRDDFRLHAIGINNGITSASRGELSFEMIDQSAKLDEPIDTGSLPDDAGPVPLALGSVYNAPAFRSSTTTLEYTASFLPVTALTPKDIGNTVPHTDDLANGTFTLDNATNGELTVDIEEQHNTPASIATWVAGQYGITVGDVDMPAYTVGLYYSSEVTGRQILDDLCGGLGAYWFLDELGELVMRQHQVPAAADVTLFEDDIEDGQISLSETQSPWASLNLRWGRNYAPLRTVAGVIEDNDATEAARLKREWSESEDSQSIPDYPLAEDVTRDSCISNATDAATERDRLLALRSVRRDVYSIDAFLTVVDAGQSISVETPRMAGKLGRIISVSRSPTRGTTALEVWV
ncbi:hypothetical protein HLV40_15150 [Chromohalobacter salexigens]|nr:hypothetical protein [Chromohalobacter salexigens]